MLTKILHLKDKLMPSSLPPLIHAACQSKDLDRLRALIAEGHERFPNFSYYKFLMYYFDGSNMASRKRYYLCPDEPDSYTSLNNILIESWKAEVGSNHIVPNSLTNKIIVRDSDYIIIESKGLRVDYTDGRQIITLTPVVSGWIFHGPYKTLRAGNYELLIEFELIRNLTDSDVMKFCCKFDVTNKGEELIYSIDSQTIVKTSHVESKTMTHVAKIKIDARIEQLVIRCFVEVPAHVKLFLPILTASSLMT